MQYIKLASNFFSHQRFLMSISLVSISCSLQTLLSESSLQMEDIMRLSPSICSYLRWNTMAHSSNSSRVFMTWLSDMVSRVSIFRAVRGFSWLMPLLDKCSPRTHWLIPNYFVGTKWTQIRFLLLVSYWCILEPIYRNPGRNLLRDSRAGWTNHGNYGAKTKYSQCPSSHSPWGKDGCGIFDGRKRPKRDYCFVTHENYIKFLFHSSQIIVMEPHEYILSGGFSCRRICRRPSALQSLTYLLSGVL